MSWIISSPIGWLPRIFIWWPLQLILCGPIALYSFFKGVYEFGPAHRQRSLWQILMQPEPPAEFWITQQDHTVHRYNPNPVSRRVMRDKRVHSKRDFKLMKNRQRDRMQSDLLQGGANYSLPQFKCPHSKITPISQGHHVFSCFTTTHASSMGFGNTEASDEMARTYYFAITVFSVPDIIFIDIPKKPPRGIITSIMMFLATFSIIFTLTFSAYLKLLWSRRKSKCKPKRRRRRKRSIEAIKRRQHEKSMRKKAKANQFISICANNFVRSEQGAVILASEGVHDINPFFDADGDPFFDCRSGVHCHVIRTATSYPCPDSGKGN